MAHAVHPNYSDKHEENFRPQFHKGPVIKHNAKQRYATTAETAFIFREIANRNGIPVQDFVARNDTPRGSSLGPIISSRSGIRTVDIGIAQLSMHSIREVCGVKDIQYTVDLFKNLFEQYSALNNSLEID